MPGSGCGPGARPTVHRDQTLDPASAWVCAAWLRCPETILHPDSRQLGDGRSYVAPWWVFAPPTLTRHRDPNVKLVPEPRQRRGHLSNAPAGVSMVPAGGRSSAGFCELWTVDNIVHTVNSNRTDQHGNIVLRRAAWLANRPGRQAID